MENKFADKMSDLMQNVFEMADSLDANGVGKNIPFVDEKEGLRGTIKTDILLFLFRLTDKDQQISTEGRNYINKCLGYEFGELTMELARRKAMESELPLVSILLPSFILLDKQAGNNNISAAYVQTLCYLALGYLSAQGQTDLEHVVKYIRYGTACIQMIEKALGEKVDFNPLDTINDDKRELIQSAVEVDSMIHKQEDDPVAQALEKALLATIAGSGSEENAANKEELREPDLVKDCGDGSDLPDEDITRFGDEAADTPNSDTLSALEEMDSLIELKSKPPSEMGEEAKP